MTALDRTAYPRLGERLTREELDARYRLSEADQAFIRATARGDAGRLTLATLLKARQDLGCFPAPVEMHGDTVKHLAVQLGLTDPPALITEETGAKTLYRYRAAVRVRYRAAVRVHLGARPSQCRALRRSGGTLDHGYGA
jgi:AraC-like DNA-binding protein